MPITSYGILVYKIEQGQASVLLAHPSGPFWADKDSWTVPKGEPEQNESELATAKREFHEETGLSLDFDQPLLDLGELRQSAVKTNHIWAINADPNLDHFSSNNFELEWPPNSGKRQSFKEVDRVAWFDLKSAKTKLFPSQRLFVDRLNSALEREQLLK